VRNIEDAFKDDNGRLLVATWGAAVGGLPGVPDADAHDRVASEESMTPEAWTFAIGRSDVSVPIRSRLVVNAAQVAIDAAIAGVGITRVP